uniref:Zf-HC2 domain-containing protein n=1 Tax=Tectimicrobiota bacterium TaxID=2528274 RepID=A0A932HZ86_UNCTE|nr:zf-HC2 domain-containing protein [Candidatus Tectomicrobia bacterium]
MFRYLLRRMFGTPGRGRVLPCREVTPLLSQFLDKELGPEMTKKLRSHLEVCSACRKFMESLEKTSQILRWDPSTPIPEEAAREMMENLRAEYLHALKELDEKKHG